MYIGFNMDYVGVFLYGFSGAVFGTLAILYVLSGYLKMQLKRYSKSSFEAKSACDFIKMKDDIDSMKMRLSSLESIFSVNYKEHLD
jgi:hypothetical protein